MPSLQVRVPATTANVGSGFDCVGIAMDCYDELELEIHDDPDVLRVEVDGQGCGQVPLDERHLVVAAIRAGLAEWGGPRTGMVLRCRNRIPHSRGLGSSASAIVAGLAFAWALSHPDAALDRDELTRVSSRMEGHPDNAGAAVWGGGVLGWFSGDDVGLVRLGLHRDLRIRVWIPGFEVATAGARSVLPDLVPRIDAVEQAIRAALLPVALERRPDLLLDATADRLHQSYRAGLMPSSWDLVRALRAVGVPATISGAGPTVFAIGTEAQLVRGDDVPCPGFDRTVLGIGEGVELARC